MSIFGDALATDDALDRALGVPSMADLIERRCPITQLNIALPTEHGSSGRNRGGTASGISSPGAPDYPHENDKDTDYETGEPMPDDTRTNLDR